MPSRVGERLAQGGSAGDERRRPRSDDYNFGLSSLPQGGYALDRGQLADEPERRIVVHDLRYDTLQYASSTDQDGPDGTHLVHLVMALW
jgi:hypothetical protein